MFMIRLPWSLCRIGRGNNALPTLAKLISETGVSNDQKVLFYICDYTRSAPVKRRHRLRGGRLSSTVLCERDRICL